MEWVHCNKCTRSPSQCTKFFLAGCGHVMCERCSTLHSFTKCVICQKDVKFIEINRSMPASAQKYFTDPRKIALEACQTLRKIMAFQASHRENLSKFQQKKLDKTIALAKTTQASLQRRASVEKKLLTDKQSLISQLEKANEKRNRLLAELSRIEGTPTKQPRREFNFSFDGDETIQSSSADIEMTTPMMLGLQKRTPRKSNLLFD